MMKNRYEAPIVEELKLISEEVLLSSAEQGGFTAAADTGSDDIEWGRLV